MDSDTKLCLLFLNRNFYVKDNTIFNRFNEVEPLCTISSSIAEILAIKVERIWELLKAWAYQKGLARSEKIWHELSYPVVLKYQWCPSFGISTRAERLKEMIKEIEMELGITILSDINTSSVTDDVIISLLKCIGYTLGPSYYDPYQMEPSKPLIRMSSEEIQYERKNNAGWQYWVRARK